MKSRWKNVSLGSLSGNTGIFTDGDWVESKDQDPNGGCRLIQMADLGDGYYKDKSQRFLTDEKFNLLNCTELYEGDVLVSRMPDPIGRACIFPGDLKKCATVVDIAVIRVDDNVCYNKWLKFCINSPMIRGEIAKKATGATRKRISGKNLKNIEISLPPLDEQKRIAEILDHTDAMRKERAKSIDLLDDLIQATFIDMFGDPVTNPKGWDAETWGDFIKVKSGNGLTAKNMNKAGNHNVYGGNGINGKHDEYMFEEERIVIGRVGVYCGAVHRTTPYSWVTDNALYVANTNKPFNQVYLKEALAHADFNQYAGRAAQPLISGSRIYPVAALYPPLEKQDQFATAVTEIEARRELYKEQLDELNNLFSALQQKAFKGEL